LIANQTPYVVITLI